MASNRWSDHVFGLQVASVQPLRFGPAQLYPTKEMA